MRYCTTKKFSRQRHLQNVQFFPSNQPIVIDEVFDLSFTLLNDSYHPYAAFTEHAYLQEEIRLIPFST